MIDGVLARVADQLYPVAPVEIAVSSPPTPSGCRTAPAVDLGRIDADQAHVAGLAVNTGRDRVAVDNVNDAGPIAEISRRRG